MLNEILGAAARYNQLLTRKFGLTGGAPSPQLTPEITPVYEIESGAEGRILQSEIICAGFIFVVAVAAKKSVAQLTNPANSNIILVLDSVRFVSVTATSNLRLGVVANSALAIAPAAGGVISRDGRRVANGTVPRAGAASVTADNDPPTIAVSNLMYVPTAAANAVNLYTDEVVIAPGYSVQVVQETVNLNLAVNFAWREVPLAAGEVGPF